MKVSGNVTYYLEQEMRELHDKIKQLSYNINSAKMNISEYQERIAVLKVHYTSLFKTALAYEDFDKEEFESCLS